MKIKTNDQVVVLSGKDKGKKGKVIKAFPSANKILIEKINLVKKHLKPTRTAPHGGIQEVERPICVDKVMLVCPHCSKYARIGHTLSKEGKNVRICRVCKEAMD